MCGELSCSQMWRPVCLFSKSVWQRPVKLAWLLLLHCLQNITISLSRGRSLSCFHSNLELEAFMTASNHSNTSAHFYLLVFDKVLRFFLDIIEKKATETCLFPVPNVDQSLCYCLQVAFRSKNKHLLILFCGFLEKVLYLFEIEEETGVLASFREVGEKHCDTDE